jgi:hypothetical protein
MFHTLRNVRTATTAKFAGTILITALIGAVTAAADDISEVSVTNSGKLPLKVVILSEPGFGDLGRSSSIVSGHSGHGTVHLKSKVKTYHWEVFALGPDGQQDKEPCDSDHRKGVSASSITVGCDHTIAEQKKPPAPPPAATAAQPTPPPTSSGQPKPPPNLRLPSRAELEKDIDDVENDLAKVDGELSKVNSKEKLEELKKRVSKDREAIDRVKRILEGPQRSVIETNPQDWTIVTKKTTDAGAKAEAFEKALFHCVLAGDVTSGDAPGSNVPPRRT